MRAAWIAGLVTVAVLLTGMPPPVVARLVMEIEASMNDPAVRQRLIERSVEPAYLGSRDYLQYFNSDASRIKTIIEAARLTSID